VPFQREVGESVDEGRKFNGAKRGGIQRFEKYNMEAGPAAKAPLLAMEGGFIAMGV